jgi:hypothetical protein
MRHYRIHIGVHKTATTHLQDHLENLRLHLATSNTKFVPRAQMRNSKIASLLKNEASTNFLNSFLKQTHWNIGLGNIFCKQQEIILSEENLIGNVDGLFSTPIYPNLEARLLRLSKFLKNDKFCLFLSIRNFAEILPSAYSEYLRHTNKLDGFDKIRAHVLSNPPSWLSFVERIKTVLPSTELKLWTFESYIKNNAKILSEISGIEIKNLTATPETKDTARLSTLTINQIEKIQPSLPHWKKKSIKKNLIHTNDYSEKFDPLSKNEKESLSFLYDKDLISIRQNYPKMLIE